MWILCTREEYAGGLPYRDEPQGYLHLLSGCNCGDEHGVAGAPVRLRTAPPKPLREIRGRRYLPATATENLVTYTFAADAEFTDADGTLRYLERRYELPSATGGKPDKTFRIFTHRGGDVWVAALEVDPLLWNLPALAAAPIDAPVYVFEGPRKARIAQEALRAAGAPGVCTAVSGSRGGAVRVDMTPLAGRRVVVVCDNDEAGAAYAQTVARRALEAGATTVALLALPGLPPKGDVVEYLAAGHTGADLAQLAQVVLTASAFANNAACQPQSLNTTHVSPHVQVAPLAPSDDGCGRCHEWRSRALEAEARLHYVTKEQTAHAQVMRNPRLSDSVKLTYMATRVVLGAKPQRDERGMTQVKRADIATLAGKSEDTVSRNLAILKKAGAVKHDAPPVKREDGSVDHYELWLGETEDFDRPENITPIDAPRPHGGDRRTRAMRPTKVPTSCAECGSTHVTIRAELVCLDCKGFLGDAYTPEPLSLNLPEAPETPNTTHVSPHVQVAPLAPDGDALPHVQVAPPLPDTSPSLVVKGRNLNVRQTSRAVSVASITGDCEHPTHMRHALLSGVVACGACGRHVAPGDERQSA